MQRKSVLEPSDIAHPKTMPTLLPGDNGSTRKPSIATSGRTPSISSQPRHSIVGLLASKRFARHITNKAMRKRSSVFENGRLPNVPTKEPTYRMAPERKFMPLKVANCIKDVLEGRLSGMNYSPKLCGHMCKIIGDEIKFEVKSMNFDRYKIICSVMIGQLKDQSAHLASRCAWDEKLDNSASYTFEKDNIFCTAVVFGVYTD